MTGFTIRAAAPEDWPQVIELGVACFPYNGDDWNVRTFWPRLPAEPGFEWQHVRVGVVDGRVVAHLKIVDRTIHFGDFELRFGGIQGVCVHPDFRQRGFAAALMQDALHVMASQRVPCSLLYGIPRYYDRFGYVNLFPSSLLHVTLEAVRRIQLQTAYRVRPWTPADVPAMLALYEEEWAARPWWSGQRTLDWLGWRVDMRCKDAEPYAYVVEDAAGRLRGYSCGWDTTDRQEVVVADHQAAAALLRHAADQLGDSPDQTVRWINPPDTRAGRYLRDLCTVQRQVWSTYRGGWMGRFIDTQAAVEAMRPALNARLAEMDLPQAAAQFEADGDAVSVGGDGGTARVPQSVFLQLLFGCLWPADVEELPGLSPRACRLLKCLFPHQSQQFAGLDWF